MESKPQIKVETAIAVDLPKAWNCLTSPEHIIHWNFASDDWHCPEAENDLRPGGKFRYAMAAKDGSARFDFEGTYDRVSHLQEFHYTLGDGRQVAVELWEKDGLTHVRETFEAETVHSLELQQAGWQAILENFRRYVEG